jgi:S1-C subfamily serine protease
MKSIGWIVGVAAFVGVFAALQLDHALQKSPFPSVGKDHEFQLAPPSLTRVALETPGGPPDFRDAAKKVVPSVVSVDRYQQVRRGFFFMDEDEPAQVQQTATGSGVIVSDTGYIVTNNHVVAGAVAVRVRTSDHHVYDAKVLGTDPRSDLAVLKISAKGLKPIEMGDSDALEVGQWVVAAGNPLGFDDTISVGVVSSLKRKLPVENTELINAIQTDAAINPGNSGGALTDAGGRLVGINSAIAGNTGQSVGIGFAIPVNRVREVFNDIIHYGYVRYPDLGVRFNREYDGCLADEGTRSQLAEITSAGDVPGYGVIVKAASGATTPSVVPGSSAEKAGIREWDVILSLNDTQVQDSQQITRLLTPMKPGQKVRLKVWSHGKVKSLEVVLDQGRGD